ncbi:hypothetical protein DYB37_004728 [Aphanomyces astaci]|uniref:Uncharacterized protein n=1 Tax=Aphanomyces astaci TaxID=112090 RepID=A0A3R7E5Y5_APHAT|nr:hypothetical protein DYB35_004158 [Aphanomyces astaci]RHZ23190.1 hypothetical protein DYB37_004728 [Aphanomyces astaci]
MKLAEAMGRLVLSGRELTRLAGFTLRVTDMIQVLNDLHAGKYTRTMIQSDSPTTNHTGTIEYKDHVIEFQNVPLMTPNGDVLVPSLSFKLVKPARSKLFYIPQRPYLTLGSLRDQILYPNTADDSTDDADLLGLLQLVQLEYLADGTSEILFIL